MDTPGEDSGFGYEDPLNLLEEGSHGISINLQQNNPDESDEGIEINPGFGNDDPVAVGGGVGGMIMADDNFVNFVEGGGVIPPHIQLQMAQQQYQIQNQPVVDAFEDLIQQGNNQQQYMNDNFVIELQQQNMIQHQVLLQQLQQEDPPGDDNNNDRPDDVNNNTTDPNLRQQQQLILEQRLQQQQQQQREQLLEQQFQQQFENVFEQQQEDDNVEQEAEKQQEEENDVKFVVEEKDNNDNNGEVEIIITNGKITDNEQQEGKKNKRKKKKKKKRHPENNIVKEEVDANNIINENVKPDPEVEIEYVAERLELSVFDPMYRAFANVFENFRISDFRKPDDLKTEDPNINLKKVPKLDIEEDDTDKKDDDKPKLSKRKLKKLTRLSVAELKQVVTRPDVVEMHDVTAKDPKLLVHLKAYRNTVPVPRHWCYKRKYLQGKRGIEKPPFDLPLFIKKTGIMEMRAALAEKEDSKTLKAKMRERVRPKMGKIDIDYQKLHDAFFKWQTKPKMTIHGDLYYEGKEFETRMKDKKPGDLSDDLRTSLGMPIGPNASRVPPPWLIAMQRYGPPPSYPHLKIPGLNAPIPDSCSFGYHAGGWGKPPVDEFGRPLYGDVFGIMSGDAAGAAEEEYIDKSLWGELESEEEEESSEEEEEEEKDEEEDKETPDDSGLQTPAEGLNTSSGFSSVPAGLETPESIELRKRRIEQDMEGGDTPAALFTVLPEKRVDGIRGAMMASTHVYDISAATKEKSKFGLKDSSAVELALDPSELDLVDTAAMEARYEQTLKEKQSYGHGEDLSDMVAEHTAKQKNKRKRQMQQQDVKKGAKKAKEFKF